MLNLNQLEKLNQGLDNRIDTSREEFNDKLIKSNIAEANRNANDNVTNALNLIAQNQLSRDFVLNSERVQEYVTLSRSGYTSIVRDAHAQDAIYAKINGFDAMDNDGNIFTSNVFNTQGYDLDHILPYEYLLDPANEDLLADIVISYNGDIEAAFDDIMTRNPKNFVFVTAHVNRSKGGNLGSSEKCKYSQLTEEQKEAVRAEYAKREDAAVAEATKNTAANKLKGRIDQLKDTFRNMIAVAVIKFAVKAVTNKIMEVAGLLMFKSVHKKWTQVLKDACSKDAVKKLCSKFYTSFRAFKDSIKKGISDFIAFFSDGKSFAEKLVDGLISLVKKAGAMALNLVLGISKLVLKAIQLAWTVIKLINKAHKYLDARKQEGNYVERMNAAKELVSSIARVLTDAIDVTIEIILYVVFKGINLASWIMPLVNIVLTVVCTLLTFTVSTFIDVADKLMVNAAERVKYVHADLF